jgi:uncharacterized membrane protein
MRSRPRLFAAIALAVAAFLLMPPAWDRTSRTLAAWDIGAVLYLGLALAMMAGSSVETTRQRARREDEGAFVILVLTVVAAIASLAAIGAELSDLQGSAAEERIVRLALAGMTILCSWFFLHTVFAIHYAHEYYGDQGEAGGLLFPDETEPDYWDFMYFSFTIGATAQTSDVNIASRFMRRLVLGHSILAFLFNTTILALVVNVGAGVI